MSQNQQKGISSAANLARLGHAVATVLQGAVSGGLHGAAVAAAKAFLPEIIKAIFYIICALPSLKDSKKAQKTE